MVRIKDGSPASIGTLSKNTGSRRTGAINPNRRKMSVSVSETFEEVHHMNKKALNILAKRA